MIDRAILLKELQSGLREMDLELSKDKQDRLIDYLQLLVKWNSVHNLTAVRDPLEMIRKHVLDSLVLLTYLFGGAVVDVGTGAGLPGLPLAIARPDQSVVLVDSNQKKITFVQHVILSLKIRNAVAVCARVEGYCPNSPFDWVVSRAFASLTEFVKLASHLCKKEGRLIAMKGAIEPMEIATMSPNFVIQKIQPVTVPGVSSLRSLVFIAIN